MSIEIILHNAKIATNGAPSLVEAIAISDGRVTAIGRDEDILRLRGPATRVIDGHRRTIIPGLNDSHMHPIRGGLNYNMELRWDGVPSLADALSMLKRKSMNVWEDDAARNAVVAAKRQRLIVAGFLTEACVSFPVLSALKDGFEVFAVADACGGLTRPVTTMRFTGWSKPVLASRVGYGCSWSFSVIGRATKPTKPHAPSSSRMAVDMEWALPMRER